jgi:RNA-directed DNA polymerase
VIRIILESIYEPVFDDNSHGFRPKRSCHTALEQVQKTWTGIYWFVEFDIKGFFDNMDHEIMVKLLEKKIDDKRFIKLISSFLKAGYLEEWKYHETYSGTPQGGIVSPILSNIYLHELDLYIRYVREEFHVGKERPTNPEYRNLGNKMYRLRKKLQQIGSQPKILKELSEVARLQRSIPSRIMHTEEYKRLKFCRYADDFVIGIIGTKHNAETIKQRVIEFLRYSLNLDVSIEKTRICKGEKGIEFLSYGIKTQYKDKELKMKIKGRYTTKRTVTGSILLSVPQYKVIQFCKKYGYGRWQENKPLHRAELINVSDIEIIETYNAELRGLANYYTLAKNVKPSLRKLEYLSQYSLFKTFSAKYKTPITRTIQKLKRGNEYVLRYKFKDDWKETKIFRLKHMRKSNGEVDEIPNTLSLTSTGSELIRRMEAEKCEYCGRTDLPVEVHHVRKLKDLKLKPHLELWQKVMIARNRKTLILCSGTPDSCHILLGASK